MAVQRYLATANVKTARRVFLITGLSNILVTVFLASLGFALLALFTKYPESLSAIRNHLPSTVTEVDLNNSKVADVTFPYYIIRFIPAGITGLVISGLLAAAMSSLSAGVNSACSVITTDFVNRFRRPGYKESHATAMRRTKIIALSAGLFMVLLSSLMGRVTGNTMEVTVRTNHVFVAPLFGLFIMALFVPFATPVGTLTGAVAGCVVAMTIAYWDFFTAGSSLPYAGKALSFQWISLVALIVHMAIALPLSWVTYRGERALPTAGR